MKTSPRFTRVFWRLMSWLNRGMLSNYGSKWKVASRLATVALPVEMAK